MALVIVLGMLVLVVVLVIAFLSSVSTELESAKSYANESEARALADSAVNIVISQIQDATTGADRNDPNRTLAWASQPGMIRTFDDSGEMVDAYKLYSSSTLRVSGSIDFASDAPPTWSGNPSLYTDLNAPAAVSGTFRYPIIHPGAVASSQGATTALDGSGSPIEGCFLNATAPGASTANPLPMPVQWLYVLKSGTISAMDPATRRVAGASGTDPIVGRIAFWTDDETCKVNVNTASEGTFWDRPHARGQYENDLNGYMPAQNEFQRFPGHPAMTCLSTVFPSLGGSVAANEVIYGITPRVNGGGSKGGTVTNATTVAAGTGIVPDTDRLFASVDEFLFSATSSNPRTPNAAGTGSSLLTENEVEKARFFITAASRAPEVNLFNKPRLSLWPLQIDPDPETRAATRTAKDKLLAFCSTVAGHPYYFQRYSTYDPAQNARGLNSNWANKQTLAPSSQSPTADWTKINRNQELYGYLRELTSRPIPGLGGSLENKYSGTISQILTEMLDHMRSGVNVQTTGASPTYFYAPGTTDKAYMNVIGDGQVAPLIVPDPKNASRITKGFGRFPSVKQAAIVFYASDSTDWGKTYKDSTKMRAVLILDPFNPAPGQLPWCSNVRYKVSWRKPCKVNGAELDFPNPGVNLVTARETQVNASALNVVEYTFKYYEKPMSGNSDHSDLMKTLGPTVVGSDDEEKFYPFFTSTILVPGSATSPARFRFEGGSLTVEIYPGYTQTMNPEDCVQTIHMDFPPAPIDLLRPTLSGSNSVNHDFDERIKAAGIEVAYSANPKNLIVATDTVRSVEARYGGPAKGDLRVFSALREVPADYFEGHGMIDPPLPGDTMLYSGTTAAQQRVHSLRFYNIGSTTSGGSRGFYTTGSGMGENGMGRLLNVKYLWDTKNVYYPIVPRGLTEARMENGILGDWDTGPGRHVDGPFINKADAGTVAKFNSYFNLGNNPQTYLPDETGASYSPNRQISSAVAFGSLPSGIDPLRPLNVRPWQTLLFCRNPLGGAQHPGFGTPSIPPYSTPPDFAFLDLFTMPVVEPYAISEPFSTAGKVNMNYQIAPFTYLTRSTAVRAVLKSTNMMAIPQSDSLVYKTTGANTYRYRINPDEKEGTLAGFEERFSSGDIFRSEAEICGLYLVPGSKTDGSSASSSPTYSSMDSWWNGYQLTGDNLREQPYGHIYPRLTTKSNTYTVHVKAQSLRKALPPSTPASDPRWAQWDDSTDQSTGEFRGSFVLERYLDLDDPTIPDFADSSAANETLSSHYKFRILGSKRFAP